jgi:hypothetical protein
VHALNGRRMNVLSDWTCLPPNVAKWSGHCVGKEIVEQVVKVVRC